MDLMDVMDAGSATGGERRRGLGSQPIDLCLRLYEISRNLNGLRMESRHFFTSERVESEAEEVEFIRCARSEQFDSTGNGNAWRLAGRFSEVSRGELTKSPVGPPWHTGGVFMVGGL